MKTLYLDLFSGISGDMFLGAMLDLGVDFSTLEAELLKLGLEGYHLHVHRGQKSGISGIKFYVHLGSHEHGHDEGGHDHEHEHAHEHGHTREQEEALTQRRKDAKTQAESGHEHGQEHHGEGSAGASPYREGGHDHDHGHGNEHEHEHPEGRVPSHGDPPLSEVHPVQSVQTYAVPVPSEAPPHLCQSVKSVVDSSHGRNFQEIRVLIEKSALSPWVKEKAVAVFQRIAIAEGQIHGVPPDQVHFHEVGAVDSIVDIVGACVGLELLGRPRVLASRVVEGTGWVKCAHGNFPIPAPATLAILGHRGIAATQCDEPHELVTPTGAALLAELVEEFGLMNNLVAHRIGIGLGSRDNQTRPNVLRAILSDDSTATNAGWETDSVSVLETNLDDTTPEVLGSFLEKAMETGALDVYFTPIQMKKNRPAVLLSLLCLVAQADQFSEMILRETSAFGVRRSTLERRKLFRELRQATTLYGEVTIKVGRLGNDAVQAAPEYESCRSLAAQVGTPVRLIFEAARAAAQEFLTPNLKQ